MRSNTMTVRIPEATNRRPSALAFNELYVSRP